MNQALALSPSPSPARGRGEPTGSHSSAAVPDANAAGVLPSPASGRGAGGEGRRLTHHEFAKQLRSHQTAAEERLWYFLRARRFLGLKFKRQKPVGPYIADFICMAHKLIVEADGGQHGSLRDVDRDIWLGEQGYTVLRFWNNEIHDQIEGVLEAIRQAALVNGLVEPLAPSPARSPARAANAGGLRPSAACGTGAGGEGEPAALPTTCKRSHTP